MPPKRSAGGAPPRAPTLIVTTQSRRRKVKTAPQTVTVVQRTTKPRRRKHQSAKKVTGAQTGWFLLGEFHITASSQPGPATTLLLHPTEFPGTPYHTACSHHTHRRELSWQLDIQVTTASNTGFRGAVMLCPDPRMDPNTMTSSLVWSAVLSGYGAMMTSTGTGRQKATLRAPQTTNELSNAPPPRGSTSWVGFALGTLVVYVLEPPIGLTADSRVTITVLARPNLQLLYPMSGFLAWADNGGNPGPEPVGAGWSCTIDNPGTDTIATNSHTASASLAGGKYWRLDNTRPTWCKGPLWVFAIYAADHQATGWQDNDSQPHDPRYFVVWREGGSSTTQVIGFQHWDDARNQCDGYYTSVPHGAELCIRYTGADPHWDERWEGLSQGSTITFSLLYKNSQAYMIWDVNSPNNNNSLRPRGLPPVPALGPPPQATRAVPTGATVPLPPNPAATLPTGLTATLAGFRAQLQELTQALQRLSANSQQQTPPSMPSSSSQEGTPVDPPSPPLTTSGLASALSQPCLRQPSTAFSPIMRPSPAPSTGWPVWYPEPLRPQTAPPPPASSWSPFWPVPTGATPQPTGAARLPSTWESPACPGCDDPMCEDCFEDVEEDVAVPIPSTINSVDSLVNALSRLGGTDV